MGTQYGPYVMYILSELLQKRRAMEQAQTARENSQYQKSLSSGTSQTSEASGNPSSPLGASLPGDSQSALAMLGALSSALPKSDPSTGYAQNTAMSALSAMSAMSKGLSALSSLNSADISGVLGAFKDKNTIEKDKPNIETMENDFFAYDETDALWHRESKIELLQSFCREGFAQAKRHGHFIIGTRGDANFIGIPGRFLIEEQPAGGKTGFTLWQPLKGGEEHYADLNNIDEETAQAVYGYWIAQLDGKTLKIREA